MMSAMGDLFLKVQDGGAELTANERAYLMDAAIDRLEHAAMVSRETDDPWWTWMAEQREREAEEAIAAFRAALDAEAADQARDAALWQAEERRRDAECEADFRAAEAAIEGEDGMF